MLVKYPVIIFDHNLADFWLSAKIWAVGSTTLQYMSIKVSTKNMDENAFQIWNATKKKYKYFLDRESRAHNGDARRPVYEVAASHQHNH